MNEYVRKLSREDINKLISVSPPREKAIICLLSLSSMPLEEVRDLTLKKIVDSTSN